MFNTFRRAFHIGYLKALGAYFQGQPLPADVLDIIEDLGWNFGQDEIAAQDVNFVPQKRTIV